MEETISLTGKICVLCRSASNSALLGDKRVTNGLVCHLFCLLLSDNTEQNENQEEGIDGFTDVTIRKEVRRASKIKCYYCRKFGATITCRKRTCMKAFHLPCGRENDTSHSFIDTFPSYCKKHREPERFPPSFLSRTDLECVICLEDLNIRFERRKLIYAGCCRARTFMHRICAQRYVDTAGYETKCPMCGNKDEFIADLRQKGVFYYMRDALWERDGDFADLHLPDRCTATNCQARDREEHLQDDGLLDVIICSRCFSFPVHVRCGVGNDSSVTYYCESCTEARKMEVTMASEALMESEAEAVKDKKDDII